MTPDTVPGPRPGYYDAVFLGFGAVEGVVNRFGGREAALEAKSTLPPGVSARAVEDFSVGARRKRV